MMGGTIVLFSSPSQSKLSNHLQKEMNYGAFFTVEVILDKFSLSKKEPDSAPQLMTRATPVFLLLIQYMCFMCQSITPVCTFQGFIQFDQKFGIDVEGVL